MWWERRRSISMGFLSLRDLAQRLGWTISIQQKLEDLSIWLASTGYLITDWIVKMRWYAMGICTCHIKISQIFMITKPETIFCGFLPIYYTSICSNAKNQCILKFHQTVNWSLQYMKLWWFEF